MRARPPLWFLAAPCAIALLAGLLVAARSDEETYATISVIDRSVVKGSNTVDTEAQLIVGDTVTTDDTGRGEITYWEGSVTRLDKNTTFTVEELTLDPRRARSHLEVGQIWARIGRLTGRDSFEVSTPNATAVVRGTAFAILCTAEPRCVITVLEGRIEVTTTSGASQTLNALEQATIGPDGQILDSRTFTQAEADGNPWIAFNLARDVAQGLATATPSPAPTAAPTPSPTPAPTPSPQGKIAFTREVDGRAVIHVIDADGSVRAIQRPDQGGPDSHPTWSPDGSKIAFLAHEGARVRSLVVMNADGSGARVVVEAHMCASGPSWSPDGTRIAGSGCAAGDQPPELFTVAADGSEGPVSVPNSRGFSEPDYSPDGRSFVFLGTQVANSDDDRNRPVAVMGVDGSGYRDVVEPGDWADPEWSPGGAEIAFWFQASSSTCSASALVVEVAGGPPRELASPEESACGRGGPAWSGDGAHLAFWVCTRDDRPCGIYVTRPDGSSPRRVADADGSALSWHGAGIPG